jgi:holo-ACP synthase CitX
LITLEQLLESRDRRAAHQRQLLDAHPDRVLLCLTVQLPGSVKRNQLSLAIARAGVEAVREAFKPEYEELMDLETGYEGYFLVPMDPLEAKRRACQLEDSHPLGRLMDLDVLVSAASARPAAFEKGMEICSPSAKNYADATAEHTSTPCIEAIGREDIGLEPRRCLLCAQPARVCMRARAHTQEELLAKIEEMVKSYLKL